MFFYFVPFSWTIDMNAITIRQLVLHNQQKICFIPIYFNLQEESVLWTRAKWKTKTNYNWTSSDAVPKTEIKENLHTVSFPVPTTYLNVNRFKVVWNEVSFKVLSGDYKFIMQSLTTSKMTKTLSQFHKAKTCWSSGIMSNFWGLFFMFLGANKI